VCTRQHLRSGQALLTGPSMSTQLNVKLLTKKLQVRAPQGLIQTQSEFMAFPSPPTSPASYCQLPFSFFLFSVWFAPHHLQIDLIKCMLSPCPDGHYSQLNFKSRCWGSAPRSSPSHQEEQNPTPRKPVDEGL